MPDATSMDMQSPRILTSVEEDEVEHQTTLNQKPPPPLFSGREEADTGTRLESSPRQSTKTGSTASQHTKPLPSKSTSASKVVLSCQECSLSFKDETALQNHVKKQHTRPFICVFHFAGCQSTFASKNEWKRHVMSQDLARYYWVCDIGVCAHIRNFLSPSPATGPASIGPKPAKGAIFARKDLFTQHVRRMHAPANLVRAGRDSLSMPSPSSSAIPSTDWDNQVKTLQNVALRERFELPTHMSCPAPGCGASFDGEDAWDRRMEHVARHLERAAMGQEAPVAFGGPADPSLMEWATRDDVAVVRAMEPGKWVLTNPFRRLVVRGAKRRRKATATSVPGEHSRTDAFTRLGEMWQDDEGEDDHIGTAGKRGNTSLTELSIADWDRLQEPSEEPAVLLSYMDDDTFDPYIEWAPISPTGEFGGVYGAPTDSGYGTSVSPISTSSEFWDKVSSPRIPAKTFHDPEKRSVLSQN